MIAGSVLLALLALGASKPAGTGFEWRLPPGFPRPAVPADNPMSQAKVELGRRLFYDVRLSANRTQSCASCHRQALAWTDGRARAVGSSGQVHRRNAPSLTNVAYEAALGWADARLVRLEDQALVPMLGARPVELGIEERVLAARLLGDPFYRSAFRAAFPGEPFPFTLGHVAKALACFERTLVSGDSAYDRLVYQGQQGALSESAWRGMRLFFSERLACSSCHAGINFSGSIVFEGRERGAASFHDDGVHDLKTDAGLSEVTHRRKDTGRFRVPTLRNVALTAPYMHDGSIGTLEEVVEHYAAQRGFRLSADEKLDLCAFLRSLTDESFVRDPRLGDPWRSEP